MINAHVRNNDFGNSGIYSDFQHETSAETASIETAKILINSVLSTKNAKFMSIDISNFYIQTNLKDFQYICFHISMIPQEIIDKNNLATIMEDDGWCYAEIRKAMYGLKESGYLVNVELKPILAKEGYIPSKFTLGLFTHKTGNIAFSLVVDDFGVKQINKADADHLAATITTCYPIKYNWAPDFYLGMMMEWDYENRTVKLLMPGYVKEELLKFQYATIGEMK